MDTFKKSSKLSSRIITILVGEDKVAFEAHEEVLTKIPYFQKCLTGDFVEATRKEISLPEDDPAVFEQVMEYAYWGTTSIKMPAPVEEAASEEAAVIFELTIEAWILADKLCMEGLANLLVDHYRKLAQEFVVSGCDLQDLVSEELRDGGLAQFALESAAFTMRVFGFTECKDTYPDLFTEYLDISVENSQHLMEMILKLPVDATNPAHRKDGCIWHTHLITPKCTKADRTKAGHTSKRRRIDVATG